MTTTPTMPSRAEVTTSGLAPDQVKAWLGQVQHDLHRAQTRLDFLRAERTRLEAQQHLLAELLASIAGPS